MPFMMPMRLVRRILLAVWLNLLLLPVITTALLANTWEVSRWHLIAAGIWMATAAWALAPRPLFLLLTYPVLLAGLAFVAADVFRSVNLLELLAVWYTFREGEILEAIRPYAWAGVLASATLLVPLALLWQDREDAPLRRRLAPAVVLVGLLLVLALPAKGWRDAWPAALAGAALEGQIGDGGIKLPLLANVRTSPRDRFESWQASRAHGPSHAETYVLVIGESVRSDRIPGCGGRPQIAPPPEESLVYCDVLAGSSSTHTSVPLLISRALPGSHERVPRDATVLKAFEAAGFQTFWLAVQERAIAWPDAQHQAYEPNPRLDREALLPLLDDVLARPGQRKLLVLHAYNAHAPYRDRYRSANAPFPDDAHDGGTTRTRTAMDRRWDEYDNAIDETMRFLRDIVARLRARPGAAFLVYTSDHGENMLDDARKLTDHALKIPTLWDTMVPGIVWASPTWRETHPDKWLMLTRNRTAALMHMDFAPTLLGAADIRYAEPRTEPVDLTSRVAPPRTRYTQVRAGETVTMEMLRQQVQPK